MEAILATDRSERMSERRMSDRARTEFGVVVREGVSAGAVGLSTGLIYEPGRYAKTDEIIALAKVAAKHGGMYASHIRNESAGLLDAMSTPDALYTSAKTSRSGPM